MTRFPVFLPAGRKLDTSSPFDMADAVIERYVLDDIHNGLVSLDGGNVVLDFVDLDGSGQQPMAMSRRYLHGEAVDQLFAQEDLSQTLGDAARNLWPLVDHLGTVRDLAKQDGTIAVHYQYDSFGNVTSGDTSQTRYLFTSREFDAATDLQYNRARWYDAGVGRWISEDPIGFVAGDANVARYVGNGVTGAVDPSGLQKPDEPTVPSKKTVAGVRVFTEGPSAGTPVRPIGDGKHIAIWGERENEAFVDYQIFPGSPAWYYPGWKRPYTRDLPDRSVSDIVIRNAPVDEREWKEIIRLIKPPFARVTISGPRKTVLTIYRGVRSQTAIDGWKTVSAIVPVNIPFREYGTGRLIPYSDKLDPSERESVAFTVVLTPDSNIPK